MEKLKKKIFYVIFLILTIFLISILCIFNYQSYNQEKNEIQNNLTKIDDRRENEEKNKPTENSDINNVPNPIFMDTVVYTIIYNEQYEVIDILNHSQEDFENSEVKEVAEKILNEENKKSLKIGNLYFSKYSYSYGKYNSLTIIDNTHTQSKLIGLLKTSAIIFVLLEIVIIIVSFKITNWIIKPVIDSFNRQKQFIADASHELKTPVAIIMANAEALENEPTETKWLNNIKSESERMSDLISDLLDLTKIENDENTSKYQLENISKVVERTILTFESLIYENKIKLSYNIQENVDMNCNINHIKQLLAILIDNAIKHSEENGEINITLEKNKNNIILKVSNKGKEIPKEIQEKIFERFYRADESRNRNEKRYGLGLAIAKSIVEKYKGIIKVFCKNGITTFETTLYT